MTTDERLQRLKADVAAGYELGLRPSRITILSGNPGSTPVCGCAMGAAWVAKLGSVAAAVAEKRHRGNVTCSEFARWYGLTYHEVNAIVAGFDSSPVCRYYSRAAIDEALRVFFDFGVSLAKEHGL